MKHLAKSLAWMGTPASSNRRASAPSIGGTRHVSKAKIAEANQRYGAVIEALSGGGYNVWPPNAFSGDDPFAQDHYCPTWREALQAAKTYAVAINSATRGLNNESASATDGFIRSPR